MFEIVVSGQVNPLFYCSLLSYIPCISVSRQFPTIHVPKGRLQLLLSFKAIDLSSKAFGISSDQQRQNSVFNLSLSFFYYKKQLFKANIKS